MKYKVGDRVKVIEFERFKNKLNSCGCFSNGRCFTADMKKYCGKVVTIKEVESSWYKIHEDEGGWHWDDNMFESTNERKIVITSNGSETLARLYEDNKVIKTAKAKCSPVDIFNFETGAKIAFDRLIEDKPADKWRVVNRPVKAGDYIRITKPSFSFNKKGDILKVSRSFGTRCFVRNDEHPTPSKNIRANYEWCYCDYHFEVVEPIETPEEKPKYYNGKVVCVKCKDTYYTVGKIYELVDGNLKDDSGEIRPMGYKIEKLSDYHKRCGGSYEFIPLVE